MSHHNIILIGMPGAGKSTVGIQLAKELGLDFIDTDVLIQSQQERQLQEILDTEGYLTLRDIEEQVLLGINSRHTLISTGGSAVYSEAGMEHLKSLGTIVFLDVSLEALKLRVTDEGTRGIAKPAHHSFDDVYLERTPLYQRYADVCFNNDKPLNIKDLSEQLKQHMGT